MCGRYVSVARMAELIEQYKSRRWGPAAGHRGSSTAALCYLSGESISTVTLTSRILASTLPRKPGGTSS
jgi:hypothetical protein